MDQAEFDQWVEDYFTMFPATREWLAKVSGLGASDGKQAAQRMASTLAGWKRTLSTTPQVYAARVTDRMVQGELEPVESFDRDKTALIVRRHAAEMRHADREDRVRRERSQRAASQKRWEEQDCSRRYRWGMGHVFREYLKLLRAEDPQATEKMRAMCDEPPEDGDTGYAAAEGYQELF